MKIGIGQAAKALGVSRDTLRRWEKSGKMFVERTIKGHRRYHFFWVTRREKLMFEKDDCLRQGIEYKIDRR